MTQSTEIARKTQAALHHARRTDRQARVGIIPNPVEIARPAVVPREVWVRWPKLRSARRPGKATRPDPVPKDTRDPVISGDRLRDFVQDMRNGRLQRTLPVDVSDPLDQGFMLSLVQARPMLRIALGVFVTALALIGVALLLG